MDRRPFQPFAVELVGGRRFEVDHQRSPVERDGTAVYVLPDGAPMWFDHDLVAAIVGDIPSATAQP